MNDSWLKVASSVLKQVFKCETDRHWAVLL